MIDFLLGAVIAALLVRGWVRGLVREAIGLAVVLVGTVLAFRLSSAAGAIVASMAGTSADVSRLIGGVAVFLLVSVGGAVAGYVLHRGIRVLPGLPTANRAAGAGFAGLAGLLVATVALSAAALMPIPAAWEARLETSALAGYLTDPDGAPQAALGVLAGDRVTATALDLQDLFGERRLIGGPQRVALPPADRDEVELESDASLRVYGLVNESRVAAGSDPLTRSEVLDGVAREAAFDVYTTGRFVVDGDVERRVEAAGVPVVTAAQLLGLGISAPSVHEGLVAEPEVAETLEDDSFRRMGVAAVDGPLGLVTVVILAA